MKILSRKRYAIHTKRTDELTCNTQTTTDEQFFFENQMHWSLCPLNLSGQTIKLAFIATDRAKLNFTHRHLGRYRRHFRHFVVEPTCRIFSTDRLGPTVGRQLTNELLQVMGVRS